MHTLARVIALVLFQFRRVSEWIRGWHEGRPRFVSQKLMPGSETGRYGNKVFKYVLVDGFAEYEVINDFRHGSWSHEDRWYGPDGKEAGLLMSWKFARMQRQYWKSEDDRERAERVSKALGHDQADHHLN
jgi:hypothetical protein